MWRIGARRSGLGRSCRLHPGERCGPRADSRRWRTGPSQGGHARAWGHCIAMMTAQGPGTPPPLRADCHDVRAVHFGTVRSGSGGGTCGAVGRTRNATDMSLLALPAPLSPKRRVVLKRGQGHSLGGGGCTEAETVRSTGITGYALLALGSRIRTLGPWDMHVRHENREDEGMRSWPSPTDNCVIGCGEAPQGNEGLGN